MTSSVKIVAILTAKAGRADELATLLRGMVAPSRAEAGNLRYDLWQDYDQPGRFVLDELYKDNEAITSHRATPHFQNYLSRIAELGERTAVVVLDVANT
ncbi:putative quinol monooxygenase [Paraburkholderia acidisoli]|uniref:Antibiotic biosynthesis monooxygenase n=1 Tax=Paraburkholderia acidisoli TaxID=2571748 RepID=A0A7Z2JFT0_9BURK|nr:putative quinol monooxygenase [Paraburkholderia acidisoli]QGZ63066.1 antibiotic biosynthesis monooxygenase [Paraburkholderia acidisoli]